MSSKERCDFGTRLFQVGFPLGALGGLDLADVSGCFGVTALLGKEDIEFISKFGPFAAKKSDTGLREDVGEKGLPAAFVVKGRPVLSAVPGRVRY